MIDLSVALIITSATLTAYLEHVSVNGEHSVDLQTSRRGFQSFEGKKRSRAPKNSKCVFARMYLIRFSRFIQQIDEKTFGGIAVLRFCDSDEVRLLQRECHASPGTSS